MFDAIKNIVSLQFLSSKNPETKEKGIKKLIITLSDM